MVLRGRLKKNSLKQWSYGQPIPKNTNLAFCTRISCLRKVLSETSCTVKLKVLGMRPFSPCFFVWLYITFWAANFWTGNCRSTSARLVDSRSLSRGTYQARRQQTKNSRLKISYTCITLFPLFVYKWYVVVTYQSHEHKCNSGKRYVVVTYRSIIFTPWKSTYPLRVTSVNWSRLGRNNYGTNGYSFIFPTVYLYYYYELLFSKLI